MTAPVFHLIIPGLPKSANVFIQRTMQLTLGCTFVRFVSSEPSRNILPDKFDEFFALHRAVGGEHFPPNEHNLRLLAAHDVRKIAVLVRDPRDAVISWWRHLERSDIKAGHRSEPSYFYDLSPEEKLRDLIVRRLPDYQTRVATWLDVADTSPTLECYINRFETFAADQRGALRTMLAFFGHDIDPVLPDIDEARDAGIDPTTHFRRGQVGSYRDEAPPELVHLFDERLDRGLALRMGWT